jgi:hypothetical protein
MRLKKIELAQIIEANAIVRLELCECLGILAKAESPEITSLEAAQRAATQFRARFWLNQPVF